MTLGRRLGAEGIGAALLRSLAVVPARRGEGVGQELTRAGLELARRLQATTVYLLTTTAEGFFARHFRFRPVARDDVAASVRRSVEFADACPATGHAMVLEMGG